MACWDGPEATDTDMLFELLMLLVMLLELMLMLPPLPAACCASSLASRMAEGMSKVSTHSSACGTMFRMALSPYRKDTTLL
jgi:hypothetical protein